MNNSEGKELACNIDKIRGSSWNPSTLILTVFLLPNANKSVIV